MIDFSYSGPFRLSFEPRTVPSRIDSRVHVSEFQWAVWLMCDEGGEGNHALIVVEGVEDGKDLFFRGEYNGPYVSTSEDLVVKDKKIVEKLPFRKVSSEKAIKMMKSIIDERDTKKYIPFSLGGKFSAITPVWNMEQRHNCLTWAIEKLAIAGIKIESSVYDYLIALTRARSYAENEFKESTRPDLIDRFCYPRYHIDCLNQKG